MAIDWTRLLLQASKRGLKALYSERGGHDRPSGPMVKQIKGDFRNVADHHHRQHQGDWLTVVDIETRVGTRYLCRCPGGYGVYVDAENVTKTRHVPEPPDGFRVNKASCEKGL
ncbi:hypothetical protein TV39_08865 [Arthrobacter sp. SPG23]|uniref:hypothetical protein n=1 Tax=Arthrobacter sp. SPG23 TaxID=1610703 RepID=UPI0005BC7437|nr:hypothetical protein [Arthrobacter sp. SPG23]KIS27833.1 hypothetical protein TV39_08865 [Arthrobacter sp. SPG23]